LHSPVALNSVISFVAPFHHELSIAVT